MKQLFKILAVLLLTVAWTHAQPSTLYPKTGDSPTYVDYKAAYSLATIVSNGVGTVTANMGTNTLSTTNVVGSLATVTAYNSNLVVKASAGVLQNLIGYNSGAAQFIQIHNTAALPANGVAPTFVFTVPAQGNFSLDFPNGGMILSTGIVVCNSSTGATRTGGTADCWFTAVYK
jgi:hypothetical protein